LKAADEAAALTTADEAAALKAVHEASDLKAADEATALKGPDDILLRRTPQDSSSYPIAGAASQNRSPKASGAGMDQEGGSCTGDASSNSPPPITLEFLRRQSDYGDTDAVLEFAHRATHNARYFCEHSNRAYQTAAFQRANILPPSRRSPPRSLLTRPQTSPPRMHSMSLGNQMLQFVGQHNLRSVRAAGIGASFSARFNQRANIEFPRREHRGTSRYQGCIRSMIDVVPGRGIL